MAKLYNEILISAPVEKIWSTLSNVEELDKYDPTVAKSMTLSQNKSGVGAMRKVTMQDGKNWFEERCTACEPNKALTYELTACSFPVSELKHSYRFEQIGGQVKVTQVMEYQVKFGVLGKIMDALMVRRQTDGGIKKFFTGLKSYMERKQ
ncbi:MAG TPA: SRPBCC family protein [Candidatus Kapabacteria bacterium]|nr:SRPBCC family protein [Candidatus Kapabacteria bacterium]